MHIIQLHGSAIPILPSKLWEYEQKEKASSIKLACKLSHIQHLKLKLKTTFCQLLSLTGQQASALNSAHQQVLFYLLVFIQVVFFRPRISRLYCQQHVSIT